MHISLTPELESRVKAKVETGFYNNGVLPRLLGRF